MWCESQGDGAAPAYTLGPSGLEVEVDDERGVVTEALLEVDLLVAGRGCDARSCQVVVDATKTQTIASHPKQRFTGTPRSRSVHDCRQTAIKLSPKFTPRSPARV